MSRPHGQTRVDAVILLRRKAGGKASRTPGLSGSEPDAGGSDEVDEESDA
jgi:hypothetical protein